MITAAEANIISDSNNSKKMEAFQSECKNQLNIAFKDIRSLSEIGETSYHSLYLYNNECYVFVSKELESLGFKVSKLESQNEICISWE